LLALAAQACGGECAAIFLRDSGGARLLEQVGLSGAALAAAERDPALAGAGRSAFVAVAQAPLPAEAGREGGLWVATRSGALATDAGRALERAARLVARELGSAHALEAYAQFRDVFEGVDDAVFLKDAAGRYLAINAAGARVLGRRADQVVGRTDAELFDPGSAEAVRETDEKILASGGALTYEMASTVAGATRLWHSTKSAFRGPDGGVAGLVGISRDISRDRAAESSLRDSEERLRLAVEAADLGVWDCDLASGIVRWSERQAQLFGYPPSTSGTLEGCLARIHADDRGRVREQMVAGNEVDAEFRVLLPTDEVRWLSCRGRVFHGEGGSAGRMLGVVRDVTAPRRAQAESQRVSAFREQLLGIVGHDLRNPLTAILAAASLVGRLGELSARQAYAVERIVSSGTRMQRLITDLLDLTRVRLGGGLPLARRPCDLRDVLRQVVAELQLVHPGRAIRLQLEGDGQGEWDPERVAQVLSNLLANALQHGSEGSEVVLTLLGSDRSVTVAVRSGGEPIPPEMLPMLFESFRGEHARRTRASLGLGLGLYIVRQIVVAHGGTVEVHSHPSDGTTFTVSLPRAVR
jgi:PAS domain S-box-containing protein